MILMLSLLACPKEAETPVTEPAPAPAPAPLPVWAEAVLNDMDPNADPCADFYRYSCGGWLDRYELPADKSRFTRSFNTIADTNREVLKQILEEAAATPDAKDADWAKIGRFYGACMNEPAIEAAGTAPLRPWLDRIAGAKDRKAIVSLAGELSAVGVGSFFTAYVEGDYKDPQLTILHITQGGLGLPDRDYYLGEREEEKALVTAYQAHIVELLTLAGTPAEQAQKDAAAILAFETALAKLHKPRAELRDPEQTYHRLERAGLDKQAPKLHWGLWLAGAGAPNITTINVEVPEVIAAQATLFDKTDLATLRAYLRFHTVSAMAPVLNRALEEANFNFYGKQIEGRKAQEDRWKRCVKLTDAALGEPLGRYFVERRFSGASKPLAEEMIAGIQAAFAAQLPTLAWMDEATRARAVAKKDTLVNMIGYPDAWRDYSGLDVGAELATNAMNAARFEHLDQIGRVGQPTDPKRWLMSPPTVNAYYHPLYNHMVFPAGILQPPFYDAAWPAALNFGAIGMVMGHELTHGFDDSGRKFDPQGRMVEWWDPAASAAFEERAQCVVDLYDGFPVAEGLNVNGELTLGENIADLGGLKTSYNAMQAWFAAHPDSRAGLEQLTDEQLFFIGFAQGWCTEATPEWEKMLVITDTHSPAKHRVNGPLMNLPAFHEAFQCAAGAPMHPAEICEVW